MQACHIIEQITQKYFISSILTSKPPKKILCGQFLLNNLNPTAQPPSPAPCPTNAMRVFRRGCKSTRDGLHLANLQSGGVV